MSKMGATYNMERNSEKKDIGFLIIHGFAGNVEEIDPLSKYLESNGFLTVCPTLTGHTGKRQDLIGINYGEWINSAEQGLLHLLEHRKRVIIIGFSMGGLIAVNLALKHNVCGIVTLSMPIYHWDFKRIFLNIIYDFKRGRFDSLKFYTGASLSIPFSAMLNFKVLLSKTKDLLAQIKCPILITQGLKDDTVKHRSAKYIFDNVSSEKKILKYYNESDHIICKTKDQKELFNDIKEFVNINII
jgi:carboxylesterase